MKSSASWLFIAKMSYQFIEITKHVSENGNMGKNIRHYFREAPGGLEIVLF